MAELLKPQPALDLSAVAPGSWLRGPAEAVEDEVDLGILGPDAEEDGFERMARQVARTYAKDETDEEEVEDLFDDDDDEEEVVAQGEVAPESEVAVESEVAAEGEVLPIGLAEEAEPAEPAGQPEE